MFAIPQVANATSSQGTGSVIFNDGAKLHGPLDVVLAPNGHLMVANSDGSNVDPNQPSELTEFTTAGQFIGQYSLDPNNGGAFGLNVTTLGFATVRVAAVDDSANVLKMWITVIQ